MPAGLEDEEFVPPVGSVRSPGNAKPPEEVRPGPAPPDPIPSRLPPGVGPVVDAFGEYAAMCLYSKNWMHREAALARMEEQVRQGAVNADTREVFRTMCNMMTRLFKDKVANVFANACKLLTSAVKVMGKELGGREVHSSVAQLVPQLIEKLGDAHAKVRDASREAILELASSDLTLVSGPLVKPVRSQSVWRIVLGRLSIMNELIPKHGLAKAGHDGLTLEAVMEFTSKTLITQRRRVRSAAVKVTLECCNIAGRAVEKFLPKNLKPAIRDIIDEGLGVKTGGGRRRRGRARARARRRRGRGRLLLPMRVKEPRRRLAGVTPRRGSSRLRSRRGRRSWVSSTPTSRWRSPTSPRFTRRRTRPRRSPVRASAEDPGEDARLGASGHGADADGSGHLPPGPGAQRGGQTAAGEGAGAAGAGARPGPRRRGSHQGRSPEPRRRRRDVSDRRDRGEGWREGRKYIKPRADGAAVRAARRGLVTDKVYNEFSKTVRRSFV